MGCHLDSDARLQEPKVPFNVVSHGELYLVAEVDSLVGSLKDAVVVLIACLNQEGLMVSLPFSP